jgi:hypothetical protein
MRKGTLFAIAAGITILACGWAAAGERLAELPRRHSTAAQDGQPVTISLGSGEALSAWAYRIGGEYAIALSFRDRDGLWSEPTLIGLDDGFDQIDPDIIADPEGNLYLAFAVRETGAIHVSAAVAGSERWFEPQQVTLPTERAGSPALRVVGDSLVMGYRAGREIRLLDWPLLSTYDWGGTTAEGIQDGPDGFPLAVLHNGQDDDDEDDDDREENDEDDDDSGGRADRLGMR